MALSALDIYKLLPKTNCKECGYPTCLAFAMQLAQKKASLDKCPYVNEEAKATLDASSQPPIRLVSFGREDHKIELGNETVLYRHEETFYHPPALTILLEDNLPKEDLLNKIKQIDALKFERVGQKIQVDMLALSYVSQDENNYKEIVEIADRDTSLALMLMCNDTALLEKIIPDLSGNKPLLYAANTENAEAMAALAQKYALPLVIKANDWETMAKLTQAMQEKGVKDLILDVSSPQLKETLAKLTQGRRLALNKNYRPLGFPMLTFTQSKEAYQEAAEAATYVCKYASIIVMRNCEPSAILPVLTTSQNIYTDPRKPVQVEAKVYAVGTVNPNSPVLVTTNFSLTYYTVEADVQSSRIPTYILVVDTEGTSVLTAYAADKFNAEIITKYMRDHQVGNMVKHKKIIIPGYVAVISGKLEETSGWEVMVGPRESSGIPKYLKTVWDKTE